MQDRSPPNFVGYIDDKSRISRTHSALHCIFVNDGGDITIDRATAGGDTTNP